MATGEERKKKTACVTGGNGYIASALIKVLLDKGYAVKTTVRNPDDTAKNSHLKDLQALGPLEVLRADLDEDGSFDDAIAGCHYTFLLAAPVNITSEDPEIIYTLSSLAGREEQVGKPGSPDAIGERTKKMAKLRRELRCKRIEKVQRATEPKMPLERYFGSATWWKSTRSIKRSLMKFSDPSVQTHCALCCWSVAFFQNL